ncbi:uncharacterized protein LOC104903662 [Beta vulgaris subsp. vulgaris]|uniref:uncharacterized protein LOC104903662 n=1 Tax=Beta vulgaris subsp. vulgaris TaxID=3555 RepID=UPI002036E94A|nr:uncharacterized protein LOC104903662 [Beta vulgaris subsp. vulgaris]
MRDMVTCFSEHAVRISETTCSSYINQDQPCLLSNLNLTPSVPNAVVFLYKTTLLSKQKHFLITVTWCRNQLGQGGLNINFGDHPSTSFKLNTFSRLFRKKKGQKSFEIDSSKIDVYWDLSSATYQSGPEPVDGYYVVVVVDSELALALGDLAQEAITKRLKTDFTMLLKSVLVSRREHYSGNALYSTKVQFCDSGVNHEIMIRCSEDNEKLKQPVLYISIDKRTVIKVRRLQWNFRGNQTVFVDGLLVDLMWDVHDWFYNPISGSAVFMFKTRSGGESRLWLEDKLGQKDQERVEFSLLIYGSKSP